MGLVNLQTDLKSLRFGHDRLGGGDSNQPYIKQPILNKPGQLSHADDDFLLRGGLKAPLDAATDVVRLTKWFFDFKSPRGLLFIAKQNLLSRIAVRTQASGVGLNEGVYTPLSTLAQAGIGFAGGHVHKQGLIPFVKEIKTYSEVMDKKYQYNKYKIAPPVIKLATLSGAIVSFRAEEGEIDNRLYGLYKTKIIGQDYDFSKENLISSDPQQILSYGGGPNSKVGIGKTITYIPTTKNRFKWQESNNTLTWNAKQIASIPTTNTYEGYNDPIISDFKEPLLKKAQKENPKDPYSTIMGIAPNYQGPSIDPEDPESSNKGVSKNIETRVHLGNPGKKGNVYNYTKGKRNKQGEPMGPVDKISAMPIYQSPYVTTDITKNDLVKFRIGALGSSKSLDPSETKFIHFRAFIDQFSDSYSGKWDAINYMGRGESFYKYSNFERSINLAFTVAAQSREELIPIYKKLNFLASNLAPTYSDAGYMGGSLVTLTLGGWCYELPGFISTLTLDIPQESPWEIAVPATPEDMDDANKIYSAKGVKELPHIVKVSGFSFTPIHTFRPAKQKLTCEGDNIGQGKAVSSYGPERYIALENGLNTNYENIIP